MKLVVAIYLQTGSCLKARLEVAALLTCWQSWKRNLCQTFVKNFHLNGESHLQSLFSLVTWCSLHEVSFQFFNFLLLFEHPFTTQVTAILTKYSTCCISLIHLQYSYYLYVSVSLIFYIIYIFLLLF